MTAGHDELLRAADALAARVPQPLAPLARFAFNYRWSWTPGGPELFSSIDPGRWERCGENPGAPAGRGRARGPWSMSPRAPWNAQSPGFRGLRGDGRSRTRTWDLFLIRGVLVSPKVLARVRCRHGTGTQRTDADPAGRADPARFRPTDKEAAAGPSASRGVCARVRLRHGPALGWCCVDANVRGAPPLQGGVRPSACPAWAF
jgi:hypothetical protein